MPHAPAANSLPVNSTGMPRFIFEMSVRPAEYHLPDIFTFGLWLRDCPNSCTTPCIRDLQCIQTRLPSIPDRTPAVYPAMAWICAAYRPCGRRCCSTPHTDNRGDASWTFPLTQAPEVGVEIHLPLPPYGLHLPHLFDGVSQEVSP